MIDWLGLKEVKRNLGKTVYYELNDKLNEYRLNACIVRKADSGRFYYQAELSDLTCNHSVLIVPLDKVQTLNLQD